MLACSASCNPDLLGWLSLVPVMHPICSSVSGGLLVGVFSLYSKRLSRNDKVEAPALSRLAVASASPGSPGTVLTA